MARRWGASFVLFPLFPLDFKTVQRFLSFLHFLGAFHGGKRLIESLLPRQITSVLPRSMKFYEVCILSKLLLSPTFE